MKFSELLEIVAHEPVFSSGLLVTAKTTRAEVEKQLSRWARSGKVVQLRRGLYCLAEPHRKVQPHPFLIANRLRSPSYISMQSALEFYGLIPEAVPSVVSATTGRPESVATPLGNYFFRHIKKTLFSGYESVDLGNGQSCFMARPEKALLDLIYLTPHADDVNWLAELRLQNLETLDENELTRLAEAGGSPKLIRAAQRVEKLKREEVWETL